MKYAIFILVFAILLVDIGQPKPARAKDLPLPVNIRIPVLLKAMAYERSLINSHKPFRIGVVFDEGDQHSKDSGFRVLSLLQHLEQKQYKIGSGSIKSVPLPFSPQTKLDQELRRTGVTILYLSSRMEHLVSSICLSVKKKRILIISGNPEHIREIAALGVVQRENKAKILINLKLAKAQGADFDARLLRLADVIRHSAGPCASP